MTQTEFLADIGYYIGSLMRDLASWIVSSPVMMVVVGVFFLVLAFRVFWRMIGR